MKKMADEWRRGWKGAELWPLSDDHHYHCHQSHQSHTAQNSLRRRLRASSPTDHWTVQYCCHFRSWQFTEDNNKGVLPSFVQFFQPAKSCLSFQTPFPVIWLPTIVQRHFFRSSFWWAPLSAPGLPPPLPPPVHITSSIATHRLTH